MTRTRASAKRAGRGAEHDLVEWLRTQGAPHAERRNRAGAHDRGDVAGVPGVVFECKAPGADQPIRFGPWLDETIRERDNDGADVGLLVIRRRLRPDPGDWYWGTNGHTMVGLLRSAGWLPVGAER